MKTRILIIAAFAAATAGAAWAQQPIVIKFSHVTSTDSPKGKAGEYFKKIMEERSHGNVKVELYPNSTLYKDKEEIEALQLGAVQMLAPAPGKFGPMGVREFEVLDLPFLFDNVAEAHKVTDGPIGQGMLKKLDSKGIIGMAFWNNGFKEMTANKPLRKPEDFRGLKFRIQSSKVLDAQMRSVGANPQVMAFSELYQGLQTGVVDGQENPTSNIYTQKMHEVQKYLTMSDHGYHGYVVIMNKRFVDGLPPDVKTTLDGAIKDTTAYFDEIAKKENDDALEKIRQSGKTQIITLTKDERNAWKKAMIKTHKQMEGLVGKDLLQSIYKETNFNPESL
ncbi:TRAP transporter substrate-binding protein [Noviherbaspirillum pedocola]|uniref:TRAP transporter substrate-binding protein n=1 Tax=Noviherbaspirillum pedocola TaxID=2801341 RepID=A0A934W7W6_9BURK|nr:TRAP transporter substrate-binding protein [Noviherbaspirillum pedocola]MBK4735129.1 TRAP transporter substrate-binding protein [Noviherbaspirillum pedocola]